VTKPASSRFGVGTAKTSGACRQTSAGAEEQVDDFPGGFLPTLVIYAPEQNELITALWLPHKHLSSLSLIGCAPFLNQLRFQFFAKSSPSAEEQRLNSF
jgi:hypothetical protein